jgi:hypothetical protein
MAGQLLAVAQALHVHSPSLVGPEHQLQALRWYVSSQHADAAQTTP